MQTKFKFIDGVVRVMRLSLVPMVSAACVGGRSGRLTGHRW